MILKELMRENAGVYSVTTDHRVADAAALMQGEHIGSVIVMEGQQLVGLLTDRDIALGLSLGAATPDSYVTELMSKEVQTVEATETLANVTRKFRESHVKRFPVVNENGNPVGIVSTDDVMALLAREMLDTCTALQPKLGHFV